MQKFHVLIFCLNPAKWNWSCWLYNCFLKKLVFCSFPVIEWIWRMKRCLSKCLKLILRRWIKLSNIRYKKKTSPLYIQIHLNAAFIANISVVHWIWATVFVIWICFVFWQRQRKFRCRHCILHYFISYVSIISYK